MSKKQEVNIEKPISERFNELWRQLNRNQRRFVVTMQQCATKKEAAEEIGVKQSTVYDWPPIVNEAVELLSANVEDAVLGIIHNAAAKAAMIKAGGLESDDERIRQMAASELIDRVLGKAAQRQEITGADGGAIQQEVTIDFSKLSDEQLNKLLETSTNLQKPAG